ncbi:5'/3'-nucleotidase SurE [Cupriavidus basilensis]|uniref:5'-nucleotidase n=1 Tax=Cupriavidus basilensis TaxID=68895 RepID=A0ABT6B369_9BURK|nr:5'/3'-nucleotidase SurE [Cupriavidus basilensis]MDF3839184.1 5'/3'-nucleotidase SurE [Cupriavidus basilensis]
MKIPPLRQTLLLAAVLTGTAAPAHALDILLSNDDGYQSPNIRALYARLKQEGHRVVMSAPKRNFSGASASFEYFTAVDVHRDPQDPNVHVVDSTPAVAAMYGLDRVYRDKAPDLVIAGPNIGWNAGYLVNLSGTIGVLEMALRRGVPAMAVSADHSEDAPAKVAGIVSALVTQLQASRKSPAEALLPPGVGLNVNLPRTDAIRGVMQTVNGDYSPYHMIFVDDMAPHALPGMTLPARPGVVLGDAKTQYDGGTAHSEGREVERGNITISVIGARLDAPAAQAEAVYQQLSGFVAACEGASGTVCRQAAAR